MIEANIFGIMPEDRFIRRGVIVRVVDGDTLDVEIDLGWSMKLRERLRLELVDTPEMKRAAESNAAKWVSEQVRKHFYENTPIIIASMAFDRTGQVRGKFGRTMAVVYRARDQLCLNELLLREKWAWPTDNKGKLLSARSLDLLTGIPESKRGLAIEL